MNTELIFRLLSLFLFLSVVTISVSFRRKAEREGGRMRTDEGSGLVVLLRLLGLVAILPLFAYFIHPEWVAWARFPFPDWVRWAAVIVGFTLVPMVYWIFASIGTNISPTQATRQGHQLVTHGPYRYVRHPLYSVGFTLAVALAFITGLWWLLVAMVVPMAILLARTSIEEARLVETFGDEYRDYQERTGRFLPKWSW